MRHIISKSFILAATLVVVFSGTALAVDNIGDDNRGGLAAKNLKTRLEDAKLRACQNREQSINNILDRISARGAKRLDVYTKIADRVQDFYVRKNLSVSNYAELIAAMGTKHDAAEAAIDSASSTDLDFMCDGTDPKGAAAGFKDNLKAEIKALHEYQQSIKDLIVAIKTSISQSQNGNTGSEAD